MINAKWMPHKFASWLILPNMKGVTKIKIKGHLDKKWKKFFDGMSVDYEGDNTVLSGNIKDDAFIHGILNRIRDLNLKLISVYSSEE